MLTLMSKEKLNFLLQIQILHFKYVWNLPSLSLARFFLIQNELGTMCCIFHIHYENIVCMNAEKFSVGSNDSFFYRFDARNSPEQNVCIPMMAF